MVLSRMVVWDVPVLVRGRTVFNLRGVLQG